MQSEKNTAFAKERRLRRIDVFGRCCVIGENASGEGDDFADVIADGKHETAAKTIVEFTLAAFFIAEFHQPAREQLLPAISFLARPLAKRIPTFRRVAEFPRFRDLAADSTSLQIVPRGRSDIAFQ